MLVLVKTPRTEISLQGEGAAELLEWIRGKYDVEILTGDEDDEYVPIESTEFWREMEKNRIGNLLAGARLKAGMTQSELAEALGIRQNMVSDYERGKRSYSAAMAKRLSKVLKVKEESIRYGKK